MYLLGLSIRPRQSDTREQCIGCAQHVKPGHTHTPRLEMMQSCNLTRYEHLAVDNGLVSSCLILVCILVLGNSSVKGVQVIKAPEGMSCCIICLTLSEALQHCTWQCCHSLSGGRPLQHGLTFFQVCVTARSSHTLRQISCEGQPEQPTAPGICPHPQTSADACAPDQQCVSH